MSDRKKLHGIGKIQYPARVFGYLLAMITFGVNQYYWESQFSLLSIVFMSIAVIAPHVIVYIYWKSNSNKSIEENALLFDVLFAGATSALMGFNFLPSIVMVTYTAAGALIAKGFFHFVKAIVAMIIGAGLTFLISGFEITLQNHNEFGLILTSGFFMLAIRFFLQQQQICLLFI